LKTYNKLFKNIFGERMKGGDKFGYLSSYLKEELIIWGNIKMVKWSQNLIQWCYLKAY